MRRKGSAAAALARGLLAAALAAGMTASAPPGALAQGGGVDGTVAGDSGGSRIALAAVSDGTAGNSADESRVWAAAPGEQPGGDAGSIDADAAGASAHDGTGAAASEAQSGGGGLGDGSAPAGGAGNDEAGNAETGAEGDLPDAAGSEVDAAGSGEADSGSADECGDGSGAGDAAGTQGAASQPDGSTASGAIGAAIREVHAAASSLPTASPLATLPTEDRNQYVRYKTNSSSSGHQAFWVTPLENGADLVDGTWNTHLRIDKVNSGDGGYWGNRLAIWGGNGRVKTYGDISIKQSLSLEKNSRYVKVVYEITNNGKASHVIDLGIYKHNYDGLTYTDVRKTATGAHLIFEKNNKKYIYNLVVTNSYGLGAPSHLWVDSFNWGSQRYGAWIFQDESFREGDTRRPNDPLCTEFSGKICEAGLVWSDSVLEPGQTSVLAFEVGACGFGQEPELSSDIDAVVKDGRVDIAASVKDGEEAVDRLVCVTDPYTPQEGAPLEVGRAEGTGEFVDIGGSFMMPPDWNEGEVHSIEMWVENDAGLKSASKTVTVLVVEAEDGTGDIMVPVAGVDVVFGEGDDAVVVKSYERATVEIAEAPADVPAGQKFAGWEAPDGRVWDPGSVWVVPTDTGGTVVFKPRFEVADGGWWHKQVHLQQADGSYQLHTSEVIAGAVGAEATVDPNAEELPQGYRLNAEKSTLAATVEAGGATVLALFLDRKDITIHLDHCIAAASPASATTAATTLTAQTQVEDFTVPYGSTLADINRATLADQPSSKFGGWFTERGGKGAGYGAAKRLKADGLTLYAHWVPNNPSDPYLTIKSVNETHPDGPNEVGDTVKVTAEAGNRSEDNPWPDVTLRLPVPEGIDLDPDSITVRDGDGNPVEGAVPVWNPDTREITVELGDIGPGESYTVDYDGTVTGDAVLPGGDIGAEAEAEGQNPDGTPHGDVEAGKVYPGGSDGSGTSGVDDPGDGRVVPVPVAPELTKEARNLQREGEASHVGDVIEYTIRCSAGPAGTLWHDVKITDEVPRDLAVDASSIAFSDWAGNALGGAAWDESSHTLTAAVGDLYGGRPVTLVFRAEVLPSAAGSLSGAASAAGAGAQVPDIGNAARAEGIDGSTVEVDEGGSPVPGTGERVEQVTDKVYANDVDRPERGGVVGSGAGAGAGSGGDGASDRLRTLLARTGDPAVAAAVGAGAVALLSALCLALARRRRARVR